MFFTIWRAEFEFEIHIFSARVVQNDGGVVSLAGFPGVEAGHAHPSVFQQGGGGFLCQRLFLRGKESVVLPQGETARRGLPVSGAVKTFFAFVDRPSAARADADRLPVRTERILPRFRFGSVFDEALRQFSDSVHESGSGKVPVLHLLELRFPFGGEGRGFDCFRQDADEADALLGRQKLSAFSFHETRFDDLLDDTRAGGRSAQPASGQTVFRCLCLAAEIRPISLSLLFPTQPAPLGLRGGPASRVWNLGKLFRTRAFHCGEERIFR